MAATLMAHGFETYVKEQLFLILKHGQPHDCNATTVKAAIKLVKIMQRKFDRMAKRQLRSYYFYQKSHQVLETLLKDLKTAYILFFSISLEMGYISRNSNL